MAYPPAPPYPQQPQPSGPRTRPGVVTAVVWTQFITAAALILTGIGFFAVKGAVQDELVDAIQSDPELAGASTDMVDGIITATFVILAGVYIVGAVFYIVLGLLNNKGKRPARILSWVQSGIALACCGLGGLIGKLSGGGTTSFTYEANGDDYSDELNDAVLEATPAWVTALDWISVLLFTIGSLVIIILLAVPAANEFFRKDEPGMMPPYGQPPYGQPPYGPGQPPAGPGQPPYGQQPPGPGQPPAGPGQPPAGPNPPPGGPGQPPYNGQ
ncbi:hypothetical protein [Glycomyces buryatensis]|uniref:Uncharacterized protein n=1 Tax=Glycomyces buryatensis TaxID=2570927 RepID=A0A4S8QG39_9ACTN|nr:hypothetical protein [Glycomyces buryatensis]THV43623.1 hypothetical protein FAB82_00785 [Glycomyces buryatensis]